LAGKEFLGLKPLTLVPIDMRLIDLSIMTEEEIEWLDNYHREVSSMHSLSAVAATVLVSSI
jgi:Xaa-Pro aminopeptidase